MRGSVEYLEYFVYDELAHVKVRSRILETPAPIRVKSDFILCKEMKNPINK